MRLYEVIVKALLRSDSGENDLLEVGVAQTFGEIAYSCRAAGTFTVSCVGDSPKYFIVRFKASKKSTVTCSSSSGSWSQPPPELVSSGQLGQPEVGEILGAIIGID
ncbi:uncharacterized protein LOC119770437 isoform X2 [Culex quinquefasciatus]|uniref:uncharacterized protein LOC119770039 n=1 Tax=Culex quinquefasciatus TaxID=7176 RepID=UPI0018E29A7E|nr:uncharacterized protein LOC119770039 [Culex quinquefasciatus]XP_038122000.1 uncharacterized protein LOC119770437 isoform X2 [Culex quinquefasciatus]XP_038122408.1 uncharacterized protein LOC119770437 isoform X2 [Culex quinquefasciatus]XP_038122456.1 uncharacterized protein LOC119770437 isoform X2 [Culex quinquefasciatus]XP_038122508.1 uncharacterized protein LOC119770437 isoform X2 [Culex quinquefasciatus]XP_038122566.1 uncharacterized protein LOC119770437 isoform X2 [Culex quinquefasciatus